MMVPVLTTEQDDLLAILGYLGIAQSSVEAQRITGLTKSGISELLRGKRSRDTGRRRHIAIVAAVIRNLSEARAASTGTPVRGNSAVGWLHTARVDTSAGPQTPLAVLSDTDLALEALDALQR